MTTTITYSTTLQTLSCGVCEIPFAMPASMHRLRVRDGEWFWCPNGHKIHYFEDENTKLRKQLEQEQLTAKRRLERNRELAQEVDHQRKRVQGYQGQLARTKKRIGKGVCPCCNRHFANVERHMATQHPQFAEQVTA